MLPKQRPGIGVLRASILIWLAVVLFSATDKSNATWQHRPSALSAAQQECVSQYSIDNMKFSPDGKYLLANWDYGAALWDVATGVRLHTFMDDRRGGFSSLAISPDSKFVLSGTWAGKAILWDRQTGSKLHTFDHDIAPDNQPGNWVTEVTFSPDNKFILTADLDSVYLWDARTWIKQFFFAAIRDPRDDMYLSPDGKRVLIENMGGKAAVWDIRTGKKIHGFDDWWGKFSPDGKYILTYTHEKVTLWDSQKFTKVHIFDGDGWGEFSPDSKYLFTNGGTAQLWIWNLAADYSRHNIQSVFAGSGFTNGIMSISPDSKYIVGMFIDERGYPGIIAGVWDVETGTEVKRFAIDKPVNYGIRITTNSRHVLLGVGDGELQLWDLHTGKKVRQFC